MNLVIVQMCSAPAHCGIISATTAMLELIEALICFLLRVFMCISKHACRMIHWRYIYWNWHEIGCLPKLPVNKSDAAIQRRTCIARTEPKPHLYRVHLCCLVMKIKPSATLWTCKLHRNHRSEWYACSQGSSSDTVSTASFVQELTITYVFAWLLTSWYL